MADQLTQLSTEQGPSLAAIPTPAPESEPMVLASNEVRETVTTTVTSTSATTTAPAAHPEGYNVVVKAPPAGGMLAYLVGPGAQIELDGIDLNKATLAEEGGNLRITLPNGAEILLLDYVNSAHNPSTVVITDEGKLPAQQLLAALDSAEVAQKAADVEPAAGPTVGGEGGGILPPTILGLGVGEGFGIFSSVIDPFAIPRPTDSIHTDVYLQPGIAFTAVNLPPTAHNDSFSTAVNVPITVTPGQLLANDTDPENDTLTIVSVQKPEHGTVSIDGSGNVVFVPDHNFQGTGGYSYTITDGHGGTSTAEVIIQIDPDPANENNVIAADDAATVVEGRSITVNVLANDSDPEAARGDVLVPGSVRIIAGPAGGQPDVTAHTNPDGSITFTTVDHHSTAPYFVTLEYEVADNLGARDTATVTLEVIPSANDVIAVDDTGEITPSGATKTFNVTGNDYDPQGDKFTLTSIISGPAVGHAEFDSATGNIAYQSVASNTGYDVSIVYEITDARGAKDQATLNIHVEPSNNVSAVDDTADVLAGKDVNINVLKNDYDAQGDSFSITKIVSDPIVRDGSGVGDARGHVTINPDGTITYSDDTGQRTSAVVEFSYEITDSKGATDVAVVRVTVGVAPNGVDANNDTLTVAENSPETKITATLLANDFDPQGDKFNITSVTQPTVGQGTVRFDAATHDVYFTPAAGYHGPVQFTYTITDALGATDTAIVSINVQAPINTTLNAGDDNFSTHENTPLTISYASVLANDNDPDGSVLTQNSIISTTNPSHGTVSYDAASGNFLYTPANNFVGTDSFTYTIKDAQGDTATATVTIRVDEPAALDNPVDAENDSGIVHPGHSITINALTNDSAPDGGLAYVKGSATIPAGSGVIDNGDGTFTYNAPLNDTTHDITFNYTVRDIDGDTDTATVTIHVVDNAPVANPDVFTTAEDTPITFTVANLLSNDTSPDDATRANPNGTPTFVGTVGALPAGLTFNEATGQFTYNPPANFNGDVSFQYQVKDGDGDTATTTVTIHVTPVDDPVFANPDTFTTNEDTPITFTTANLLSNDSAPDGGLAFVGTVGALPAGLVYNSANGTFTYNPPANFNGDVTFQYQVRDADGDTATTTVTIHVLPVNDPVFANPDSFTTAEDTPITFTTANLLSNDSAPDGGLAFVGTVGALPAGLVYNSANGTFTYNPPANFHGDVSFQYQVRDADGDTATTTVTIHVTPVNDPVFANPDSFTTNEDTAISFTTANLLSNDSAPDGGLAFVGTVGNLPAGLVYNSANGTFTYNPPANFNGDVSFQYQVRDADGDTATTTVTIHVLPVDDAVIANPDEFTTRQTVAIDFTTAQLLSNDSAPDGGLAFVGTVGTLPAGLTYNAATGQFHYAPPAGVTGDVSFQYQVRDADGSTANTTVTIHVLPNNVVAVDDTATMPTDVNSILINAKANDYDPQGDAFSITRIVSVDSGTATIENGQIRYNNGTRDAGTAHIVYEITDAFGATSQATVTVNIAADTNNVVAVHDSATTTAGQAVQFNVLTNDYDPQGDAFTLVAISPNAPAGLVYNGNGTFTFTGQGRDAYDTSFSYTIQDSKGAQSTTTVDLHVNAAANNVVAVNDAYNAGQPGNTIAFNVLTNDYDPQGDAFSVVAINGAPAGLNYQGNGVFLFTGQGRDAYDTSFSYVIQDAKGAQSTATVYLHVDAAPNNVVAVNDSLTVASRSSGSVNAVANDYDPQGDAFHIIGIVSGPSIGSATVSGGNIVYNAGSSTSAYNTSLVYRIQDSRGAISDATVSIHVNAGSGGVYGGGSQGGGGGSGGGGGDCPLTIDLNGDGISIVMQSGSTAHFDLNGDGSAEWTSWVNGSDDAILAIDRNGDGIINNINEVFGGQDVDGFTELGRLEDSNHDGVIDKNDAEFSSLKLWLDANHDGITDAGELHSLADFGITSIQLGAKDVSIQYGDAYISKESTVTYADGHTTDAGSVFYTNASNGHLTGTAGNDVLVYSSAADTIDGGQGFDTLKVLSASDIVVNHDTMHSVESIDMANNASDKLTLNVDDVLKISDNGVLTVTGDAVDQVTITGDATRGADVTQDGHTYASYGSSNGGTVLVELGMSVTTPDQQHHG